MPVRPLTIEEIEAVAAAFKEDLARKTDRLVRQDEGRDAYAAVLAKEYIDQFVSHLQLLAGSRLQEVLRPARARPISLARINRK